MNQFYFLAMKSYLEVNDVAVALLDGFSAATTSRVKPIGDTSWKLQYVILQLSLNLA